MTRAEIVAAAIAALAAQDVDGYEVDDLKKMQKMSGLPANYAEVHLSRTAPGIPRSNGVSDVAGWRLQLRVCCMTMTNANKYLDRTHAAFYGKRIGSSSPLIAGPTDVPDYDDGRYAALAEFTFTI